MAKRSRSQSSETGGEIQSASEATSFLRVNADAPPSKLASLEPEDRSAIETRMRCMLPPHEPIGFALYSEYERHYQDCHTNRCRQCGCNFPSDYLLQLHIAENHDPIVAAKRDKGEKTFACFVQGCDKACSDWKKRRSHLVDKHGFPRNYDFLIVDSGIDGRRSMLRSGVDAQGHRKSSRDRASSATAEHGLEITIPNGTSTLIDVGSEYRSLPKKEAVTSHRSNEPLEAATQTQVPKEVDALASSMSSLSMIPRSITFGKRKGKSGFSKK